MGACTSSANQPALPAARTLPTLLTCRTPLQPESSAKNLDKSLSVHLQPAPPNLRPQQVLPAEGTGPLSERLNAILELLWPKLSAYATESIMTELQPQLQQAMPRALQGICFDEEKCHLGHKPVQFRRIDMHKETQATATGHLENLVFTIDFEWNADCEIFLKFAGTGIGLRGVSIKGTLMQELVGLMDRPPFVQGVRSFLANPPEIDLEFQGAAESLLNLGSIRQQIINVIRDQINSTLVVPNRMGVSLVPDADIFVIKSPPAQGILEVTVWSAKQLPAMDFNWFSKPSSDPYVTVGCGAHSFRSQTKCKTLSPQFEYTVTLPIWEEANQCLRFELFDEDTFSGDDFLGRLDLPVKELISWGSHQVFTHELLDEKGNGGSNGEVCLSAVWRPLLLDATGQHSDESGLVFAGVYSAWNLPHSEDATKYWVNVCCSGLMHGFDVGVTDTPTLEPDGSNPLHDNSEDVAVLKEKLEVLRKHNVSKEDIAKILEVDVEKLDSAELGRSDTGLATGLAGSQRQKVNWDNGFEFPVEQVNKTTLSFDLKCQGSSGTPRSLGVYTCSVAELASCENCTSWRTVRVPGTPILLKLKIAARYLDQLVMQL